MKEPLTGREITGVRVYLAIGEHLSELSCGRPWRVLLSRFAHDLLRKEMPNLLRHRLGTEYLLAYDKFNPQWSAEVRVVVTDKELPWVENDGFRTRLTYGTLRMQDSRLVGML